MSIMSSSNIESADECSDEAELFTDWLLLFIVPLLLPMCDSDPCNIESTIKGDTDNEWLIVLELGDPIEPAPPFEPVVPPIEHQPIEIIDLGNLVRHNIKNVHASTGCCWLAAAAAAAAAASCLLFLPPLAEYCILFVGRIKISAFNISGAFMCSACRAKTLKAGSTVRVEVNVSLIPFWGCVWTTS